MAGGEAEVGPHAVAQADQSLVDLMDGQTPRVTDLVEGSVVFDQGAPCLAEAVLEVSAVDRRDRFDLVDGLAERGGEALLGAESAVQVHDQAIEALGPQSLGDRLDGGPLLSDEQDSPTSSSAGGDQVGDRLALPRTGRALDDEWLASRGGVDGIALG